MTFPRIFSRGHATRVEAERLRRENEALRSALTAAALERDHYKAENTRFLAVVQSRNLTIRRLEDEVQRLRRDPDGRFCKKNCTP